MFFLLQPFVKAIVDSIRPNIINVSPKRRKKKVLKALLFFIFSIEVTGLIDIGFGQSFTLNQDGFIVMSTKLWTRINGDVKAFSRSMAANFMPQTA